MGLSGLRAALAFLTVLPVGGGTGGRGLGRPFFPAVGLLLGVAAWAAFALASAATGPALGAVAAIATLAVLTGGLHLDGLADSADGLLCAGDPQRRLEVMRDPRVGAFGAVAVALVLLGDVGALTEMDRLRALAGLAGAGSIARLGVLGTIHALPYVRPAGLGVAARDGRWPWELPIGLAAIVPPLALDWRHGLAAVILAALATLGIGMLARRRIGGATGDVYGAVVEVGQLAVLVGYSVRL